MEKRDKRGKGAKNRVTSTTVVEKARVKTVVQPTGKRRVLKKVRERLSAIR